MENLTRHWANKIMVLAREKNPDNYDHISIVIQSIVGTKLYYYDQSWTWNTIDLYNTDAAVLITKYRALESFETSEDHPNRRWLVLLGTVIKLICERTKTDDPQICGLVQAITGPDVFEKTDTGVWGINTAALKQKSYGQLQNMITQLTEFVEPSKVDSENTIRSMIAEMDSTPTGGEDAAQSIKRAISLLSQMQSLVEADWASDKEQLAEDLQTAITPVNDLIDSLLN